VATQVAVPDIGDFDDVPVIEVHVAAGDVVAVDDPLVTLESDKATMDVPSTAAGEIRELFVKEGDRVSEGTPLVAVEESGAAEAEPPTMIGQQEPTPAAAAPAAPVPEVAAPAVQPAGAPAAPAAAEAAPSSDFVGVHAGPSVRRLARELGVELSSVDGTGPKGRITKEDLLQNLRGPGAPAAAPAEAPSGMGIPPIPAVDFSKFGPIEVEPLPRIKKISGPFLHRSWLNIPHVTHGDEADITELDAYRKELDTAAKAEGYRVTLLAFLLKASVAALRAYPTVNSSLSPEGDSLILKKYINIGVAVDTPDGLVVPVITDVDRKGITELSKDLGAMSVKARDGKLGPSDLQGGTFTISSLGGIGGTNFTPIVNAPEVAILGVVRSKQMPVWNGKKFHPRLMLPVFLSYDHRVIDGALAARFMRHLCDALSDMRRLVL
jgi:pyruvate dehydrogenase E2 component (dihydrolipoyllysine-residue acetyltransferase)